MLKRELHTWGECFTETQHKNTAYIFFCNFLHELNYVFNPDIKTNSELHYNYCGLSVWSPDIFFPAVISGPQIGITDF